VNLARSDYHRIHVSGLRRYSDFNGDSSSGATFREKDTICRSVCYLGSDQTSYGIIERWTQHGVRTENGRVLAERSHARKKRAFRQHYVCQVGREYDLNVRYIASSAAETL